MRYPEGTVSVALIPLFGHDFLVWGMVDDGLDEGKAVYGDVSGSKCSGTDMLTVCCDPTVQSWKCDSNKACQINESSCLVHVVVGNQSLFLSLQNLQHNLRSESGRCL